MSRVSDIRNSLEALQEEGFISSWYVYAPGDRGNRWVVEPWGGSMSTREVESFIRGAKCVMFKGNVYGAGSR